MSSGVEKAWETISGIEPAHIAKNSGARLSGSDLALMCLGQEFIFSRGDRKITASSPEGESLMGRLGYFFNHSALWYLACAKDIPFSGRLIKPQSVKGGHHFFSGTHELPLEALARKYSSDKEGFLGRAARLGGRLLSYGDASVELPVFPRLPITLILWLEDEEFPPRADLLLDSTCETQLTCEGQFKLDIIWSAAMLAVLAMMAG